MDRTRNMKNVIVDIETDSLNPTKIHCIEAKDLDTSEVKIWDHSNLDTFKPWSTNINKFIMHNGISFDAPVLNRLLGTNIKLNQVIDTLVMSQLFNPMREQGHSLSAWGDRLSYPKRECDDFTFYTPDMLMYCKNDVNLTENLYKQLLIEGKSFSYFSIDLEHKIRAIIAQQEKNGFALEIQKTIGLLARLTDESLLSTYLKADEGLSVLNPVELHKFAAYMRLLYMQTINDWLLGAYENNRSFFRGRLRIILTSAGAREFYVSEMRTTMSWFDESGQLRSLGDTVYEEHEGKPVPA